MCVGGGGGGGVGWSANWKSLQLLYYVDIVIDVNRNILGVSTCIFRLLLKSVVELFSKIISWTEP